MFIEHIDKLRCVRDHEDSWLVASFTAMSGRFVIEAKLGCPVCGAIYEVRDGVPDFGAPSPGNESRTESVAAPVKEPVAEPVAEPVTEPVTSRCGDDALKLAAMLNLTRPGLTVLLDDAYAALAEELASLAEAEVFALNPPPGVGESERATAIRSGRRFPFAQGSMDGIALGSADADRQAEAARLLRQSGRLVIPAAAPLGAAFHEVVRDDRFVVGEYSGPLVKLSR